MKVYCPSCSTQVLAVNVNLHNGWGKCDECQDVFPLAEVLPGFHKCESADHPLDRPFNARATLERTAEELFVRLPPEGMRVATIGLLGFTTFWLAFIAFWTACALGIFEARQPAPFNRAFASFSIPFWLVGFGLMAAVAWRIWGAKSLRLTRDGLRTSEKCLAWSRSRWVEIEQVQHARAYHPQVKSEGASPHAVELVYHRGSFVLPVDSKAEECWLIAEINEFMRALAA